MADQPARSPFDRAALIALGRKAMFAAFAAAVGVIAAYFNLPPTVVEVLVPAPEPFVAEAVPIDYEGCSYHGPHDHDDAHAIEAEPLRWPTDRITYGIDYGSARGLNPPLSDASIQAAIKQAANWWSESLAIEMVEVPYSQALIPIRFERLDGPGGTLAEAYLANGTLGKKPMRVDASERWTAGPPAANLLSMPTVVCHELGHSLGLPHDVKTALAVMIPTYTSRIPREQPRDIDRAVNELGYARRPPAPGDGVKPGGTAELIDFPVSAKASDIMTALKARGYKVEPPK